MDISTNILQDVEIPSWRSLNSNHGDQVKHYRSKLYATIITQQITEDLAVLKQVDTLNQRKRKHTKRLIQIDRAMTQAKIGVEKSKLSCTRGAMITKIKEAYNEVNRMNRVLKHKLSASVHHIQSGHTNGNQELENLWKERSHAIQALQGIRHDAYTHRQTYLEEAVNIQELKGNTDRVKILRKIRTVEELSRTHGYIPYTTKDTSQVNGLTQVSYPTKTG